MKTAGILTIWILVLGLLVCLPKFCIAEPIGTAFTYQGRLIDGNDVADGLYDFQFKLFDDPCVGILIAGPVNEPDLDVIDGYFTVELDFNNPNAFNGEARWLEIAVRPGDMNDPNVYTFLSPRQEVTPTPYALYAANSGGDSDWMLFGNDMYSIPSGNVGIGITAPGDKLDVDGHINSSESYKLDGDTILSNTGTNNIFVGEDAGVSNTTGQANSAVGVNALRDNTEGGYNSAMGFQALYSNTGGNGNSAMGYCALRYNTTGGNNSTVGTCALYYNTTGHSNSAVGYYALFRNTTGYYNSAVGRDALFYNTTGYCNSAVGMNALRNNTEGYYNSAIGRAVLSNNTEGYCNSAVGDSALYCNTTGYYNLAVGKDALFINSTGHNNTAVGAVAGGNNSTGSGNVFLGYKAGFNETGSDKLYIANSEADANVLIYGDFSAGRVGIGTTGPGDKLDVDGHINSSESYKLDGNSVLSNTGTNNIFVGEDAGVSNTTGNSNSAVGYDALFSNTTGYQNSAVGYGALFSNTTGYQNSAMGHLALRFNTMGWGSSAVGHRALFFNTTGYCNSATGNEALYSNTTGYSNSAVGYGALRSNTTGRCGSAVGYYAFYSNTTGNYNSAVGCWAGFNNSTGSGNVFIGYSAGYNETGSNKLYIDNSNTSTPLIYGEFDNDFLAINGDLGVGTMNPQGTLDVNGPIYQRGGLLHADYVFEPDYQLESIDEHSKHMWRDKHLPAIPKMQVGNDGQEIIEIGSHQRGIVEELEKAHIYIEQLHNRIRELEKKDAEIMQLKERVSKMEALLAQLLYQQEGE